MLLFPAIDILNKRAVRLLYGDRNKVTDYGNPLDKALYWRDMGATFLHIVDLNAAFDNDESNLSIIKELSKINGLSIQLGGGVRNIQRVKRYIEEFSINRVIIGTSAICDVEFFDNAVQLYKNKIVCGIDIKDGFVAVKGWVQKSTVKAVELALSVKEKGVDTIVYTDIQRDGALTGVNIEATFKLTQDTGMNIIASGGLNNINEISKLKELNIYGAILGRSIYEKTINLKDAISLIK